MIIGTTEKRWRIIVQERLAVGHMWIFDGTVLGRIHRKDAK